MEKLFRERICAVRSVDRKVWDRELCVKLQKAYMNEDGEIQLPVPSGCSWVRHASITFHYWPIKSIITYIAAHRFWNVANHVALADLADEDSKNLPVRFGLAFMPENAVKETTHLQQKDLAIFSTLNQTEKDSPKTSFAILLAVAWRDNTSNDSVVKSKPEKISTEYLDDATKVKIMTPLVRYPSFSPSFFKYFSS